MSKWLAVTGVSIGAGILLLIAHRLMNPIPIPAATTALGGILVLWINRGRVDRRLMGGALAGGVVGSALHVLSHVSEGRMHPDGGFAAHVVGDAFIGILMGSACLAAVLWPRLLRGCASGDAQAG